MGKNEDEIQPLNAEDSLVDVVTGEDSPKSKSPRHGHSTSKEASTTVQSQPTDLLEHMPVKTVQALPQ